MPEEFPRISIVTPAFNQGEYIEKSILSVINQGYPNLEYIIMDGGSTDNTVEIIRKYEGYLSFWASGKDEGMYDALNRGLNKATGEIMGWLNSDDLLIGNSLFTLSDIFTNNPDIRWLQGYPCVADESGRIVYQRSQRSSKFSFFLKEYHDGIFIQQESTYWRRNLWVASGSSVSTDYKFAGDFELWMRFFKYADQFITPALIGVFRMRQGQISEKYFTSYLRECDQIIDMYTQDLSKSDIAELKKRKSDAQRHPILSKMFRKLGLITSSEEKRLVAKYDYKLQKFVKSSHL